MHFPWMGLFLASKDQKRKWLVPADRSRARLRSHVLAGTMIERTLHQKIDQECDYDQTLLRPTIAYRN